MFDKLRATVLTEAAAEKADLTKDRKLGLARKLVVFYAAKPELIDQDYERLMSFGGRTSAQVSAEIDAATASPRGKIATLVNTRVFTDERGASQIYVLSKFLGTSQ